MPAGGSATAKGSEGQGGGSGPYSVFVVAGEASGDWAGALLVEALRRQAGGPAVRGAGSREPRPLRLIGIGGRRMAAAGVDLLADSSSWGAIGVLEAARKLPGVWRGVRAARSYLAENPPSALVLIDCGAVNVPLARWARGLGVRILYYFPPGSWSRRPRSLELRELVDVIATPFLWSRDLLAGGRARVEWVGHPVVEAARPALSAQQAWERYRLDPGRPVVALAPGSREQEIRYLLPAMAEAAGRLGQQFPGLQFLVPVAASVGREQVSGPLAGAGVRATLLEGMDYDALQLAGAALVCAGTATLEFACLRVPMLVVYRASRATTLQYRLMRGLIGGQRFAAMPNILAGREVVRELLGSAASPAAMAREAAALLSDPERRTRARRELEAVVGTLGPPGASDRTARMVLELIAGGGGKV